MPVEGSGTLALSGDMKKMDAEYVSGVSLKGYGVSLSVGVGIPIPVLNRDVLKKTTVKNSEILACVIDYSKDYPESTGKVLTKLTYEQLRQEYVEINGKKVKTGSMSSYSKALKIADILKEEITSGKFLLSKPHTLLSKDIPFKKMKMGGTLDD